MYLYVTDKITSPAKWSKDSNYPLNYFQQPLEFGSVAQPVAYRVHKVSLKGMVSFDVQCHIGSDGFRMLEKTSV